MDNYLEAATIVLASLNEPNAVLSESLLGLARAWDYIELTGEAQHAIPSISLQMRKTLIALDEYRAEDIWDDILSESPDHL